MSKNVASQKLPNFLFTPLHENGQNSCSSWANWEISLPKPIYYSRAICWYPQITRGHVSRAWKRVSKFLKFDMKKLKKPVFKYTILAFRKHMSLLWRNFLLCLSSVGKCVWHAITIYWMGLLSKEWSHLKHVLAVLLEMSNFPPFNL